MRYATRSQGHSSAGLRRSESNSDLTDPYEVEGSPKHSKTTKRVDNTKAGAESDSNLSSQFCAVRHDRCDRCDRCDEDEEMDSEEDARTYSAYHGSDSEVPVPKLEKKQSNRVKDPRVEPTTLKEKGDDSALQSDTEGDIEIPDVTTMAGKAHILALIDDHRLRVEAHMKKVNIARNALHVEEKQYMSLQRRLDRLHSSIAPVHRLPYELIGEIAALCVEEGHSPWELVTICRSWRVACFSTPRLWSGLRIILSPKTSFATRFHDGKENCFSTGQFDEAMERAGATPLHLEFSGSHCDARRWRLKAQKNQPTIDHIMGVLSSAQQKARVKSLSVSAEKCKLSDQFFAGPFPALEHISLIKAGAISILPSTRLVSADWAPRLHSAEFLGTTLWDINKLKWIERLTKLTIDSRGYSWGTSEYCDTLGKTKLLTTLALIGIRRAGHTRGIELPCLRVLEIRSSSFRCATFKTPVLEKLVVEKTEWLSCRVTGDPVISTLKEIKWVGYQKDYILPSIEAHSVGLVDVDFRNGGGYRITSMWNGCGYNNLPNRCVPDKLQIKHSGEMPKENRLQNGDFLRVLPNVKEVKMMNIGIGKPFLKELAKRTKSRGSVLKQQPLCPRVEVLELDMTHVAMKERQAYERLVRAVVKARGLRSMKCIWDKEGVWEEFGSCGITAFE